MNKWFVSGGFLPSSRDWGPGLQDGEQDPVQQRDTRTLQIQQWNEEYPSTAHRNDTGKGAGRGTGEGRTASLSLGKRGLYLLVNMAWK